MATFNESLTRMRRFLRDPDANIWDSEQMRLYWNQAAMEIAEKIGLIERIRAYAYPPKYLYSYMWDWEWAEVEGERYQALHVWPTRDITCCYVWEPGYYLSSMNSGDDGYRFIHPWESAYGAPADVIRIPLHVKFHKAKYVAFDEERIDPLPEREIAEHDQSYKTKAGAPRNYYRPDQYENDLVLYPRPSSVTWDDAMWLLDDASDAFGTASDDGIVVYQEDGVDEGDYGIVWDTVDLDGQLFMIMEVLPDDVESSTDTWDDELPHWPPYIIPAIEYAVLERCFGADTDGFIPSLRDYWELRKKIMIQAIKQFKAKRLTDRDFRLGGRLKPVRPSHVRLPSDYPAQWP